MPNASYLTDGTALNGTTFSRPLVKYGTGTLTIAGAATYTEGTTVKDGVLALGGRGRGGRQHPGRRDVLLRRGRRVMQRQHQQVPGVQSVRQLRIRRRHHGTGSGGTGRQRADDLERRQQLYRAYHGACRPAH